MIKYISKNRFLGRMVLYILPATLLFWEDTHVFSKELPIPFQAETARVFQNLAPIQTISLEYKVERKRGESASFQEIGKYRLIVDKGNDAFHLTFYNPNNKMEVLSMEKFYKKGVLTSIQRNKSKTYVDIRKQTKWDFQDISADILFSYADVTEKSPLVKGNKIDSDVKFSNFQRGQRKFFKIEDTNLEELGTLKYNFLFDIKTGLLAEANFSSFVKRNGKLEEEKLQKRIISDYAAHNGFFFPADTIFTFCLTGSSYHIEVDKRTIQIGEPVDDKEFEAALPPGSTVRDSIKGISYVTPSVGNTGAEEKIAKELDTLFEKTDK